MTGEAVARVKNVSHRYGTTVSLADVSIDIPSRIMVGVIGPDGVGKSTLLGLIAGVKVIQSGEVVVFDKNVANKETLRDIRGRIACRWSWSATRLRLLRSSAASGLALTRRWSWAIWISPPRISNAVSARLDRPMQARKAAPRRRWQA